MSKLNALVCGLVLVAAGPAAGQEARPGELRKVSQIIGSSVLLQDNASYGKVEDIVLNEDGCIEYVVVSREDRYALMPWGVATVDYGQRTVVFDVTPQVVQPLFFARDAWPNVADPQFNRRVGDAFGPRAIRREVGPGSVRPGREDSRSAEPSKAKSQARPGRGPDSTPPADQPKSKASAKDRGPDSTPPADQPRSKASAKDRGPDSAPTADQPRSRPSAKEKGPDGPPPADRPKAEAKEKPGRP